MNKRLRARCRKVIEANTRAARRLAERMPAFLKADREWRKSMLTTAQAATRLRSDSSRVCYFIKHGLAGGTLKLRATKVNAKHGGKRYAIRAEDVKAFAAKRKKLGI